MAYKFADRTKEATTTTGLGTITLLGAATNFKSFAQTLSVGDKTTYCIEDATNNTWEIGVGTLATSSTLTRDYVISSSAANAKVNFVAGTKSVFITSSGTHGLQVPERPAGGATTDQQLQIFNKPIAGRASLAQVGPYGLDTVLQPHLGRNKVSLWYPAGNATAITVIAAVALSATGTATASNFTVANRYFRQKRVEYLATTASTTAVAGFRNGSAMWTIGGGAGDGGFTFVCRFGIATGCSNPNHVCFVGVSSLTTNPTSVQPSSLSNHIGVGWDSSDANLQIMSNGAGTTAKIDLGSNFLVPTIDRTATYELSLFAAPGSTTSVGYEVVDLVSGATATGVITSNLPNINTPLTPRCWTAAGGTSSVTGITLMSLYMESDY